MLAFPAAIKIFVAIEPLDMRKQFNGRLPAVPDQNKKELASREPSSDRLGNGLDFKHRRSEEE